MKNNRTIFLIAAIFFLLSSCAPASSGPEVEDLLGTEGSHVSGSSSNISMIEKANCDISNTEKDIGLIEKWIVKYENGSTLNTYTEIFGFDGYKWSYLYYDGMENGCPKLTRVNAIPTKQTVNNPSTDYKDKIIFVSDRDIGDSIFMMDANGSNPINITKSTRGYAAPVWSPQKDKIAYYSMVYGKRQIFVMDADGGNQTKLTLDNNENWEPAWSPDGKKIAYTSGRGDSSIFVIDANGKNQINLTKDFYGPYDPSWSPDGTKIAFCKLNDIYIMDADGSNITKIIEGLAPAWSPDGKKLAYINRENVFVINIDGSNPIQVTNLGNVSLDFHVTWSPDGTKLAFGAKFSVLNPNIKSKIYVIQIDGSNQVCLTCNTEGNDSIPSWAP